MIAIIIITFLIILTLIFKIRSFKFALLILGVIGVISIFPWFDDKVSIINHHECVIGKEKKINGILFNGCFDIWHYSHIILYMLIGLLYPNDYLFVLIISIIWEVYEHFMFKYLIKKSECNDLNCLRIEDVLLNLLGYFIGSNIR
jgi:hypothetical protein